ncbi:MAG: Hsp33 family molecular chaperone HslO [Gammaproteobacteria bacterium]|nr:MAG: Hsp33 family molecular chaperone HslO [Gammaproteobacteria bacterium]
MPDASQRFVFENADIRGDIVCIDECLHTVLDQHDYPRGAAAQLGEFIAAAVLLTGTLKFSGKLIVEMRSNSGQVPLMMAECTNELGVRAIARGIEAVTATDFPTLFAEGYLAITIDPDHGERYQGVVAAGESLAGTVNSYFAQSEQLGTRLWLHCDRKRAGGLLLQQLPSDREQDPNMRQKQWQEVCALADTLTEQELLNLSPETLLYRLFHEHELRLFATRPVAFHCSCSRERVLNALFALPQQDLQHLLEEHAAIGTDCEFCQEHYRFSREELSHLITYTGSDSKQ